MMEEEHCFELWLHVFSMKQFSIFLLEPGNENQTAMFISEPYWLQFPKSIHGAIFLPP